MISTLPVRTHIDLGNEFNTKRRIHVPKDPNWIPSPARVLQPNPSNSLAKRLFHRLAATFGKIRHQQPAQGESLNGATAHCTPYPRTLSIRARSLPTASQTPGQGRGPDTDARRYVLARADSM